MSWIEDDGGDSTRGKHLDGGTKTHELQQERGARGDVERARGASLRSPTFLLQCPYMLTLRPGGSVATVTLK